jgi:lipid II:glycine glycyltransferase (peptidoglycan interpeptide bridge formation enzyme)
MNSTSEREALHNRTLRIVQNINEAPENMQYFSAAFLDISQAIHKLHTGLLYT